MSRFCSGASAGVALAILLALPLLAAARPAHAVCTGRSSVGATYFDGWGTQNEGTTVGGAYARIENQTVVMAPGTGNTSAWVMISGGGGGYWAQIGWVQWPSGNRHTLIQVIDPVSENTTRHFDDPPQPVGTYPYYTVLYNNTPGKFTFQVDGAPWPWSGYQVTAGFVPNQTSMAGETKDRANQMPGTTADALGFFDAHKYKNGAWGNFNGSLILTNPIVNTWLKYDGPYSGTTHYIWDGNC